MPTEQLTLSLTVNSRHSAKNNFFEKNSRAIPNPVLSKNQLKMNLQHFMRL